MGQTKWRIGEQHLIENYEQAKADNFNNWVCHHRLEISLDGDVVHSADSLKRMDMYYNRPYFELIYLTRSEHQRIHKPRKGTHTSETAKANMLVANRLIGNSKRGIPHSKEHNLKVALAMKGKKLSDEHKRKLSEAHKGKFSELQRKAINEIAKGKHWKVVDGKRVWYS